MAPPPVCELNEPDGLPHVAQAQSCHDPEAGAVQIVHATLLTHSIGAASAMNAGEA